MTHDLYWSPEHSLSCLAGWTRDSCKTSEYALPTAGGRAEITTHLCLRPDPVCRVCLTLPKYIVNNVRYSGITKRAVTPPRARPVFPLYLVSRLALSVA